MTVSTIAPPTATLVPELERRELNAVDRCDACGARAWVRAVMPASELLFCAHHAHKHLPALEHSALFLQDDREQMGA